MIKKLFLCITLLYGCIVNTSLLFAQIRFKDYKSYSVGAVAQKVCVADLNNDGLNDVVFGVGYEYDNKNSYKIFVCTQNKNGELNSPVSYNYPESYPGIRYMITDDINKDKRTDVLIAFDDYVGIFYQNQTGSLNDMVKYSFGREVSSIATGDFDKNGYQDIVASLSDSPFMSILYQNQSGFELSPVAGIDSRFNDIATGDFDQDSNIDIIFPSNYPDAGMNIYYPQKDNLNERLKHYSSTPALVNNLQDAAIGDLNNDGRLDVAASKLAASESYKVSIWYNDPNTNGLQSPIEVAVANLPESINIADMNCDGNNDIIVGNGGYHSLSVLEKDKENVFKVSGNFYLPFRSHYFPQDISIGDLNNDNKPDIAIADNNGLVVLINNSIPKKFDKIHTTVTRDTLKTFKSESSYHQVLITRDTLNQDISIRTDSIKINRIIQYDNIQIDTLHIRAGNICNQNYQDTILISSIAQYQSVNFDTTIISSKTDLIPLVNIFPNPARDQVFLEFISNSTTYSIEIFNESGKLVYKNVSVPRKQKNTVPMQHFSDGVYIFRITIDNSTHVKRVWKSGS